MLLTHDGLVHTAGDEIHKVVFTCHEVVKLAYIYRFTHKYMCICFFLIGKARLG